MLIRLTDLDGSIVGKPFTEFNKRDAVEDHRNVPVSPSQSLQFMLGRILLSIGADEDIISSLIRIRGLSGSLQVKALLLVDNIFL